VDGDARHGPHDGVVVGPEAQLHRLAGVAAVEQARHERLVPGPVRGVQQLGQRRPDQRVALEPEQAAERLVDVDRP
jgi:hypothetical protein